jgi:hypothetical protein
MIELVEDIECERGRLASEGEVDESMHRGTIKEKAPIRTGIHAKAWKTNND